MNFALDPRLANSGILLGETNTYVVNLANDQRYPWVILIPKVSAIYEVHDLSLAQQSDLWQVSASIGQEMMSLFGGDKFNVAAIGNVVKQLHVHHIVRFKHDDTWPQPVWGRGEPIPYDDHSARERVSVLQSALTILRSD